jgi:RNA polymerase sigma-70 factor (ECF subfamily)
MARQSDRELVDAARSGDAEAFGTFVRRHQRRVYRLAVHMLRNSAEAEDVAQEAFVRAFNAIDRFDGRSEPFTWLYRITVNLSLNAIRSRKASRATTTPEDPRVEGVVVEKRPLMSDPGKRAVDRQLAMALAEGMDALSETLRTTLILVAIDGLSHAEAGAVLGCPEGTVAWRVHEARKKLRLFLESRGHETNDGDRS